MTISSLTHRGSTLTYRPQSLTLSSGDLGHLALTIEPKASGLSREGASGGLESSGFPAVVLNTTFPYIPAVFSDTLVNRITFS